MLETTGLRCARRRPGTDGKRGKLSPSFTVTTAGQRQLVDVSTAGDLLLAAHGGAVDGHAFEARGHGPPERVRDADPDLVVPGVRGLVAEKDKVERPALALVGADRVEDRARGRLGIPFLAVDNEVDGAVDAQRHRVPQLLFGFRRPQGEDDRLAPVRLDEPDRLLDAALLVRADGEAEVPGLDRLRVVGRARSARRSSAPASRTTSTLHDRILVFSGSKIGREPTTSTVTG